MIGNIIGKMFERVDPPNTLLLAVAPPRTGDRTMLGVENMLASIAVPEPFSLELAGDSNGVTLMARCAQGSVVKQQLAAHYPQALIQEIPPHQDPLLLQEGEQAWSTTMRVEGPEFLPLQTFHDRDLLDQGSDPLIALVGSLSNIDAGERVSARLHLQSLGPQWSQPHREHAHTTCTAEPNDPSYTYQTRPLQMDGFALAALGGIALVGLQCYLWMQNDEAWKAALLSAGAASAAALAGWAHWRRRKSRRATRMHDPRLIQEKTSRLAFEARLELTAILSPHGRRERAVELLSSVATAYRHYDNPAGARFQRGKIRTTIPTTALEPSPRRPFQRRNVLGMREAAALWHPPGATDDLPLVERSGPRSLLPSARGVQSGARVGHTSDANAGRQRNIYFPDDLMRRHHLYVARTRMGKSTLMQHLILHKMHQKDEGADHDSIVVIDPHADLVESLLHHVPPQIIDQVRLIDLADDASAPGINLLDTHVFQDRDRTADSVVRIARGLWDQWGPRMQSILEHVVKTLHEANLQRDPNEQSTILDGLRLLSDSEFRGRTLARLQDPFLLQWWARDFASWHRQYRAEALAPVQTRLAYYASSKRARAILGQPRSTIDLRKTISNGGILLVSTAQATAGRDVAALVGASILNLLDSVIRERGTVPAHQRTRTLITIDEMQSIAGVDYESMLSELGKFGASFVLATQSLARLKDLSHTMQDTLLANTGCLAVFQVAAADARQLVWELDKDRVSEEDLTSLPVHHCYVRATVDNQRLPTFSMAIRKPRPGDPNIAARIREAAAKYTTPAQTIADAEAQEAKRAERIIHALWKSTTGTKQETDQNATDAQPERKPARRRQRSKRNPPMKTPEADPSIPEEEQ